MIVRSIPYYFLLLVYCTFVISQLTNRQIPFILPQNCTETQFFNPFDFSCQSCPSGAVSDADRLSCQCPKGSEQKELTRQGPSCSPCKTGEYVIDGRCTNCGPSGCSCAQNEVRETTDSSGLLVSEPNCTTCNKGTVPNDQHTRCEICSDVACFCNAMGSCINKTLTGNYNTDITLVSGLKQRSKWIEQQIGTAHDQCSANIDAGCQQLINLCVLQNFDTSQNTACDILVQMRDRKNWRDHPWLVEGDVDSELSRESAITKPYLMGSNGPNGTIQLVVARYELNGRFAGFTDLGESHLFLCEENGQVHEALVFGRRYKQGCTITFGTLLKLKEQNFFEVFLKFSDPKGNTVLYPVPVLNDLIRFGGQYVNSGEDSGKYILTKRFFTLDTKSLNTGNNSERFIRIAASIKLHIEMQSTRDGLIYPPFLKLSFIERVRSEDQQAVRAEFLTEYGIDPSRHDRDIEITMSSIAPSSIVWAALCAYSWGRRSGKQLADGTVILHLLLHSANCLGEVFFLIPSIIAVFVTWAYKTQTVPFYMIPSHSQEQTLFVYLLVAVCMKLFALLHRCAHLSRQETFFIDWERPKSFTETVGEQPPSMDLSKNQKEQPVVVWRTYLVANEWNELQNYRKTSVVVQMIFMLFLLEFMDWKSYAAIESGFNTASEPNWVQSSRFSLWAVAAFTYFIVGLLQWIIQVLIIERINDPFHNFIDLCSISNISVLSLTHSLFGYYIHGRSVHGRADTGMTEMNEFLQRERDNLCGFRGLEPSSELQTFALSLSQQFRKRYDEILAGSQISAAQSRLVGMDVDTAKGTNI